MQRAWLVVPALALVAGLAALGLQRPAVDAIALALLAAGLAAALRALNGDGAAAVAGTAIGGLVAIVTLLELGGDPARHAIAAAAAAWTIAELARVDATHSPLVAMLPACLAAVLDPSYVALVTIAGARLVTAPWQRPRWIAAVPALGLVMMLFALLAVSGPLAGLGAAWTGHPLHAANVATLATRLGDVLGPIAGVAAITGFAFLVGRGRHAQLAIVACAVGAVLVALRGGGLVAPIALAGLSAGLAVTRFAATIRLATGQAVVGATLGLLLILPPAWSTIEHLAR